MTHETSSALETLLAQLFPLIVPTRLFQGGVPVAQHALPTPEFTVAWAVLSEPKAFMYLTLDKAGLLDDDGAKWQARAVRNMAVGQPVNTHERKNAAGELLWCGLMHPDAFGSSRVLLAPAWARLFPKGYWIAIPDRSCGMILSKSATAEETAEMRAMVTQMFTNATTPMSDKFFEPEELAIPGNWLP